ncbi:4'-phosphopantetheinyl transferase superfamily protein, partial [Mycobacterium tuberculosis]
MGPDAERSFCTPVEQQWLARLAPDARALAATLLFSSKEAFLKAQAPVTGRIPDLREIEVHVRPGVFEVQPNAVHRPEASLRRVFHGRYEWLQ